MNTTTHLARHMLSLSPNKDAARLCLYHFLIHHCDKDTPLSPLLFENFCRMALSHNHWQENCVHLSQEIQYVLQHYNETFMLDWSMKDFHFPDHWQVIAIKNSIEGIRIYEKWLESKQDSFHKSRIFYTKDKNYLILLQNKDNSLSLIHCNDNVLIHRGELQPLNTSIQLHYNENIELKPKQTQYLKVDNNSYARFQLNNGHIEGMIIRGYIFQNHQKLAGKINEYPILYYPFKRIEQYYVDKKSDPDYQELVEVLEKAKELFNINHPEAFSFGRQALERGQTALKHIYNNDNIVETLVEQLSQEFEP